MAGARATARAHAAMNALGVAVVLAGVLVALGLIAVARLDRQLRILIIAGVLLHLVGAAAYYVVISHVYRTGDFLLYLDRGQMYAERIERLDFSMFTNSAEWAGGKWWGTQFVAFPIALIDVVLGSSAAVQFTVFSLLSLVGVLAFGAAFHRVHPDVEVRRYLRWAVLFPSLWFWPSAPGKESLILLGTGVATLGYAGRRGSVSWLPLGLGLALVLAIRPQVALVFLAALVVAPWFAVGRRWSLRRTLEAVALGALALAGSRVAASNLGMGGVDAAEVTGYIQAHGRTFNSGGSDIKTASADWQGAPVALATIWLRPFPWEARSITALLSALEVAALWILVLSYRREVVYSLSRWRHDRLLRFALPFMLYYSVAAGMTMWNLGIIARQRILLFPFLFLLFPGAIGDPVASWSRRGSDVRTRRVTTPLAGAELE